MEGFLEFLSNNELTIVICLMVVIFGLIMTILIIDIYSRRTSKPVIKKALYDDELDRTDININTTGLGMVADASALDSIDVETVTKNLEKTQEIEEIKYVEEDEDLEKTKALLELETIKQELSKIENQDYLDVEPEVTKTIEEPIVGEDIEKAKALEELEEVKEELDKTENQEYLSEEEIQIEPVIEEIKIPTMEEEVERFESDQEEHAIISVEELTRASQNITEEEIEAYEDDGNEPISIKELEEMYKSVEEDIVDIQEEEKITLPDFEIKVKSAIDVYEDKNFKNTPVISPVFGVKQTESSINLEHTANLDKLNDEIKKTNEFLSMLKELRKNLD